MDNKNVFVAIALSMSVLLFWGAFFETPRKSPDQQTNQKIERKTDQGSITPTISQPQVVTKLTREESISKSERVTIENNSIKGSINLKGALIDDISFKKHKQKVEDNKNIIFLNPSDTENGFYIETGWTSIGNKIKVPTKNSESAVKGNDILNKYLSSNSILFSKVTPSLLFHCKIIGELSLKILLPLTVHSDSFVGTLILFPILVQPVSM